MTHDPMLDGITRWTAFESLGGLFQGMNKRPTGKYVLFSDLPALLAAAREEAAEAAMQIGRQIEKDNHAAGLCEPSYTHGREYQQQRLTSHDMHSGLACLTNYEQGQRDERAKWSVLIKDRIRDLQSCTKHDDCMGKADILLVILDDYDYGVAREEKS